MASTTAAAAAHGRTAGRARRACRRTRARSSAGGVACATLCARRPETSRNDWTSARQHLGPSPSRAHEIERARARDGGEPGGDTPARGVELAGRTLRLAERIRDDFFRVRAFPDDGARQGVDGAPVAVVQLAQGALV